MSSSAYDFDSTLSSPTSVQRPQSYTFSTISKGTTSALPAHPTVIYETSKTVDTQSRSTERRRSHVFISFYRSLSWIFGFREKFSLLLCTYLIRGRLDHTDLLSQFGFAAAPY
ncbi:hypothetical protein GYMLUDRAFT_798996 [Collybiopsis luxurians FD-317 M1]|nr:hypothetical protein GYMLUDRAFT_798996 [Collybiopsis luxurians FD-317 M1]